MMNVVKSRILDWCKKQLSEADDWHRFENQETTEEDEVALILWRILTDSSYKKAAIEKWQPIKSIWSPRLAKKMGILSHNLYNL